MHIAVVCPEMHGHLNPMTTLAGELHRRGHRVTLFCRPGAAAKAARSGIGFRPVGVAENESGRAAEQLARLATLKGVAALMQTCRLLGETTRIGLRDLPDGMRAEGIDAVLTDQVSPEGGCTADHLGLPLVVACNALALHQEPGVPPAITGWSYRRGPLAHLRNRLGNALMDAAARPFVRPMAAFRAAHRQPAVSRVSDPTYALA